MRLDFVPVGSACTNRSDSAVEAFALTRLIPRANPESTSKILERANGMDCECNLNLSNRASDFDRAQGRFRERHPRIA